MNISDEKGNIAVILCLVIAALFGFMAYVIDMGIVYSEKTKLSNAIDSAVLAAALELPTDRSEALKEATAYLEMNNVDLNEVNISISQDNKSIEIEAIRDVQHYFAKVLGVNNSSISVATRAIVGPVKSVTGGIRPFAVEMFDYSYGELVTLKEGAGDGYHGNYGAVALGGRGACVLRNNALYGYSGTLTIGDKIDTEPGNMASVVKTIQNSINSDTSTFSNFDRNSPRIWTIPLVDSLEVNGRKEVTIVGFAQVFVEDVIKKSGKAEIKGRFMRYVTNGEIDLTVEDTGSYGVKLDK